MNVHTLVLRTLALLLQLASCLERTVCRSLLHRLPLEKRICRGLGHSWCVCCRLPDVRKDDCMSLLDAFLLSNSQEDRHGQILDRHAEVSAAWSK